MRRKKYLGVYSNGTIKRCYAKACCLHDPADLLDWVRCRYVSEEHKQKLYKTKFHQFFLGNKVYGKEQVPFSAKMHRRSKRLRNLCYFGRDLTCDFEKIYLEKDIIDAKCLLEFEEYLKFHARVMY